jgi:hypothetical protein
MRYGWSKMGVEAAVEDVMRLHPELAQPYWVAEGRDSGDYTWHVELDPTQERRVARLTWQMVECENLEEIAEALQEAACA